MHIAEGYLPLGHALGWTMASAPFVIHGAATLRRRMREHPESRLVLAAAGAFCFVLSALKLPSVAGSSSHPTGSGLGAMILGPAAMPVLGTMVLLFQALLLAHGGLTTLGANVFSMAVVGPWVSWAVYRALRAWSAALAVGLAAALGDLATYCVTAGQLALAFPDPATGFTGAYMKFMAVFGLTQFPLAVIEGVVTVLVLAALERRGMFDRTDAGLAPEAAP